MIIIIIIIIMIIIIIIIKSIKLVAAAFMFKLTLFQIFGPRNHKLFCPLIVLQTIISNAICDLMLQLFGEGINISFR